MALTGRIAAVTLGLAAAGALAPAHPAGAQRLRPDPVGAQPARFAPVVTPPLRALISAPDTVRRRGGWPPGVLGVVIGGAVGAGAGLLLVAATCDVQDCASHPDTRRLVLGGGAVGAAVGVTVDVLWRAARRATRSRASTAAPAWSASPGA